MDKHETHGLRRFDLFGAPVGVTFKGESFYKTKIGGIVTLLLFLLIGSSVTVSVYEILFSRSYTSSHEHIFNYSLYTDQANAWTMSTSEQTLAGQVKTNYDYEMPDGVSVHDLFRIQFYRFVMTEGV